MLTKLSIPLLFLCAQLIISWYGAFTWRENEPAQRRRFSSKSQLPFNAYTLQCLHTRRFPCHSMASML
jgi:hypothetical protein